MQKYDNDHKITAVNMDQSEEPTVGNFIHDILNTCEGVFGMGGIMDEKDEPTDCLNYECGKRHEPQCVQEIYIARQQIPCELLFDKLANANSYFEPVL